MTFKHKLQDKVLSTGIKKQPNASASCIIGLSKELRKGHQRELNHLQLSVLKKQNTANSPWQKQWTTRCTYIYGSKEKGTFTVKRGHESKLKHRKRIEGIFPCYKMSCQMRYTLVYLGTPRCWNHPVVVFSKILLWPSICWVWRVEAINTLLENIMSLLMGFEEHARMNRINYSIKDWGIIYLNFQTLEASCWFLCQLVFASIEGEMKVPSHSCQDQTQSDDSNLITNTYNFHTFCDSIQPATRSVYQSAVLLGWPTSLRLSYATPLLPFCIPFRTPTLARAHLDLQPSVFSLSTFIFNYQVHWKLGGVLTRSSLHTTSAARKKSISIQGRRGVLLVHTGWERW